MSDIVIYGATVLTVDDDNRLLTDGTVVVEDGHIAAVRPSEPRDVDADADRVVDGSGKLVMPGLVNLHSHNEITPLLGAFSEMELTEMMADMTALVERVGRGDFEYLVDASYRLSALNFLRAGITTVNSMDARPAVGAPRFGEAGLRAYMGPWISDMFWDVPIDEQFDRARSFVEEFHESYDDRIRATVCPHDDWSLSREVWERVADLADDYPELRVHTHILELDEGNVMSRANGGEDTMDLLDRVGLLDDRLVAAHFRVADEEDVERLAAADAAAAHCPSIFTYWSPDGDLPWFPLPDLRSADATVGLGLDDHYWHDSYNLFGEARHARMLANHEFGANQISSMALVRMLTIEGARALGVGDELGSLEPGKHADFLVVDLDAPKFAPVTNVPALVVNSATPADVETVVVDGEVLVEDGQVRTMDESAVLDAVADAVDRFEEDTGWDLSPGRPSGPSTVETLEALPKRGPMHLFGRLAVQRARDGIGL